MQIDTTCAISSIEIFCQAEIHTIYTKQHSLCQFKPEVFCQVEIHTACVSLHNLCQIAQPMPIPAISLLLSQDPHSLCKTVEPMWNFLTSFFLVVTRVFLQISHPLNLFIFLPCFPSHLLSFSPWMRDLYLNPSILILGRSSSGALSLSP